MLIVHDCTTCKHSYDSGRDCHGCNTNGTYTHWELDDIPASVTTSSTCEYIQIEPSFNTVEGRTAKHREICEGLTSLYEKKNHDYGDSFHQTFLEEGFAMARIRLSDKLNRFKTLSKNEKALVDDESLSDTLLDLCNYSIMTILEIERTKGGE